MARTNGLLYFYDRRRQRLGVVYTGPPTHPFARRWTGPNRTGSTKCYAMRAITYDLTQAWKTLDVYQHSSWAEYAYGHMYEDEDGEIILPRAISCFTKCNHRRVQIGLHWKGYWTLKPHAPNPTGVSAEVINNMIIVRWESPLTNGVRMEIWRAGPMSPGRAHDVQRDTLIDRVPSVLDHYSMPGMRQGLYWFSIRCMLEDDGDVADSVEVSALVV